MSPKRGIRPAVPQLLLRLGALTALCVLVPLGTAAHASGETPTDPGMPPPDTGAVASAPPSVVTTPDGWVLTLGATNETQLPVAPLTTAVSSREYLAAGTFTGTVDGSGSTELDGGTMVVGYQIGCGILLDKVVLSGGVGLGAFDLFPFPAVDLDAKVSGAIKVDLQPGLVRNVPVMTKKFSGTTTRVTLNDVHISIDGCLLIA